VIRLYISFYFNYILIAFLSHTVHGVGLHLESMVIFHKWVIGGRASLNFRVWILLASLNIVVASLSIIS
jgi:hypothetical protein